jgi:hypothetical protein
MSIFIKLFDSTEPDFFIHILFYQNSRLALNLMVLQHFFVIRCCSDAFENTSAAVALD